ncbi:MAG: hypothetical protein A3I11_07945 [Elusimicrobia bacterium RIFCSPLOWO2_02_FULL_39_32]|nr:MAG: hypothetical protein A3B80_04950 [Elusimicrobia bacterium RIFCSPHIGHO2_02_FULL_39_36]OGR93514.1 MAG: hypothetical protein A3I11_07945 [Elusimicrobia bacterium RIFCSPLOWO2_02_FULL_39_32]OGS00868.1 MAG: hypothetical protein A3G85_08835 [Elusimicrobia bacterium RIFCSPLOWO2_12_FULL_39_28]
MRKINKEMLNEYDFSKGVRGKYTKRYAQGTNLVMLSADVKKMFNDSESVNAVLRIIAKIARRKKLAA